MTYTPEQKVRRAATARARKLTAEQKERKAAYGRARRLTAEQKIRDAANQKAWLATAKAKASRRAYSLMKTHGITPEQYDLILAAQDGRCAICRCMPRTRMLAVDHCHKTKEKLKAIRGLLCSRCNHQLLGAAHDKPEILDRAAAYLRHPPAPSALYAEEGIE